MKYLIVIFTIFITVLGYISSRYVFQKTRNPILNPVLLTTLMVIAVLTETGLNFEDYKAGKEIMTFLLGPATVALALPLYKNRHYLWSGLAPVMVGIATGSLLNILTVIFLGKLVGFEHKIIISLAPKSITAPIAVEVAKIVGGDPALTAIFVVFTGLVGASLGPIILNALKVGDPVARGLSIGTTSHGQGTAVALEEGETQGALSGVAMALSAVFTSVITPYLIALLKLK